MPHAEGSADFGRDRRLSLEKGTCHETALDVAVWADFWWTVSSETSPIDPDRFRGDLTSPKLLQNPGRSRVSLRISMFLTEMEGVCRRQLFGNTEVVSPRPSSSLCPRDSVGLAGPLVGLVSWRSRSVITRFSRYDEVPRSGTSGSRSGTSRSQGPGPRGRGPGPRGPEVRDLEVPRSGTSRSRGLGPRPADPQNIRSTLSYSALWPPRNAKCSGITHPSDMRLWDFPCLSRT